MDHLSDVLNTYPNTTVIQPSCGAQALYIVLELFGKKPAKLSIIEYAINSNEATRQSNLLDIKGQLEANGLYTLAVKSGLAKTHNSFDSYVSIIHTGSDDPALLQASPNHFEVLVKRNDKYISLNPPNYETCILHSTAEVNALEKTLHYDRVMLLVSDRPIVLPNNNTWMMCSSLLLLVVMIALLFRLIRKRRPMVKKILLVLFAILTAANVQAAPKLDVLENGDTGLLPRDLAITRTIEYRNAGTQNLVITKFSKSCGCAKVEMGKTELAPGESSSFKVLIDAGMFVPGKVDVALFSNDPEKPIAKITIRYAFFDPLVISPPFLYIEKDRGVATSGVVYLQIKKDEPGYVLKEVRSEKSAIAFRTSEIRKGVYTIVLHVPATMDENSSFNLNVIPEDAKYGNYTIPVKVRVASKVRFFPQKLIIRRREDSKAGEQISQFKIVVIDDSEIENITTEDGAFTFSHEKIGKGEYIVKCLFNKQIQTKDGYLEHVIKVYMKNDSEQYILPFLYLQET